MKNSLLCITAWVFAACFAFVGLCLAGMALDMFLTAAESGMF